MVEPVKMSVVMSVYNGEQYLREAIDSILAQTLPDFEFIIIDDGSSDSSAEIVKSYTDTRIRFIQQENQGLAAALNRGVLLARTGLIARMDQDDISMSDRFEKQYQFLQAHGNVIALGGGAEWIDKDGMYVCKMPAPNIVETKEGIIESPFFHPTVVFRKVYFDKAGGYPEKFKYAPEDTVLFNRMRRLGNLENLDDCLIKYRLSTSSMSLGHVLSRDLMIHIVAKEMDGTITKEDYLALEKANFQVTERMRAGAYHGLLARKYIWNNPNQINAIKNALKSIYCSPKNKKSYLILIAALVPLLTNIVLKIKSNLFKVFRRI